MYSAGKLSPTLPVFPGAPGATKSEPSGDSAVLCGPLL